MACKTAREVEAFMLFDWSDEADPQEMDPRGL